MGSSGMGGGGTKAPSHLGGGGKGREKYRLFFLKESSKLLEEPMELKGGGALTRCKGRSPES